jgi:hypothetical protein
MARVSTNLLVNGLSGRLGKTLVFKTMRGKTIVCQYSVPNKKQSVPQQENRSRFRQATAWAKAALQDPDRKKHYGQQAKKQNLPNA